MIEPAAGELASGLVGKEEWLNRKRSSLLSIVILNDRVICWVKGIVDGRTYL
ncbi:MAG: hypothetical protein ACLUOS_04875 [Odoribacter splanchnicus]